MLANVTLRADIQGASATTINFAASAALSVRPIRLWAPSGRQAALTALPTALTISGTAGTRYVYASLAAPSGDPYSTASGGILDRILSALSWNREDWYNGFRAVHPGDGTLVDPARNSAVTFVETASATPPDTHHVPLGQFECAGGVITSLTSYEGEVSITVSAFIHGQCQLVKSGADLKLQPRDGASLVIGGTARSVPAAGVTLAPTGLTPGTWYQIYAAWSGSAVTTEPSTTDHTTHTDGVDIKSGDSTRTYLGRALIETGPVWSSVVMVRSRFHDPVPLIFARGLGAPFKTVVSTAAETSIFPSAPVSRGGSLGSDRGYRVTVSGDVLNNTGSAHGFTLRIKYGATTIGTLVQVANSNATRRAWRSTGELMAAGATNAQTYSGVMFEAGSTGVAGGDLNIGSGEARQTQHSAVAEDSTVDKALDITIQPSTSSANLSIRVFAVLIEQIEVPA